MHMKKIYLAGPKGFSEAGKFWFYERLIPLVEKHYDVVDPWKFMPHAGIERANSMPPGPERERTWAEINDRSFDDEVEAIKECDGMIADLDGDDVDSGTCVEIGIAYELGKKIVGYRGDWRPRGDNPGLVVNLMPQKCIEKSGGVIVRRIEDILPAMSRVFGR